MNFPIVNKFLIIAVFILLIYVFFNVFTFILELMVPFIVAFVLAFLTGPLKRFLHFKLKFPKALAALISMLVLILVIFGIIYFVVSIIIDQAVKFSDDLYSLNTKFYSISEKTYYFVEEKLKLDFNDFDKFYNSSIDSIKEAISKNTSIIGKKIIDYAGAVPTIAFYSLIALIATFFMSMEYERIMEWLRNYISSKEALVKMLRSFKKSAFKAFVSYLKAQVIIMSITFVIAAIGFTLLGYKYGILLGLLLGFLDALPIFGSGSLLWPLMLYRLFTGQFSAALFHFILYIILVVNRQILEPRLLSSQIGINPLLTLITLYIGFSLFGIIGMVLGILVMVLSVSLYKSKDENTNNNELEENIVRT